MEEEILIGPVMAGQEGSAGTLIGPEGVLKDPALKKRCIMQYATGAAKGAKFHLSPRVKSRFIAATASEKMTGWNQEAPRIKMNWELSTKSWIEFWKH